VLRAERERLQRELAALPGVAPFPSEANMILVRVPDAGASFAAMKSAGVLVKNVEPLHRLLLGCLRITVGTPEENTRMIEALRASLR
jgi:histidinol-phosphate aminotransferase